MTWIKGKHNTGFERNCPVVGGYGGIPGEGFTRGSDPFSNPGVVIAVTNEDAHTGDYSLKITGTKLNDVASSRWYHKVAYAARKVGFWYKPSEIYSTQDETCVFSIYGNSKYWVKIYWNENGTLYADEFYQGIMAASPNHPVGEWVHIGILYYLHETNGFFHWYVNGQPLVEYTGYTAPNYYYDIDYFYFGSYPRNASRNQGTPVGAFYDDVYMLRGAWTDSKEAPPDSRFYDIVPNGNGYYTGWAASVESPPLALYEAVDDVQTETDTPNIKSWTDDQRALFTMQDIVPLEGLEIPTVLLKYSSKRTSYPPYLYLNPGLRTNGVDLFGSLGGTKTTWEIFTHDFTTDAQDNAWTPSSVNATEMGIRTRPPV